jgi:hypothetical protein
MNKQRWGSLLRVNFGNLFSAAASNRVAKHHGCHRRFIMLFVRFAGAFAALLLASNSSWVESYKVTTGAALFENIQHTVNRAGGLTMIRRILILGASYGSLFGTKLLMAVHVVTLVCRRATADLINMSGTEVCLPLRDETAPAGSTK